LEDAGSASAVVLDDGMRSAVESAIFFLGALLGELPEGRGALRNFAGMRDTSSCKLWVPAAP